MLIAARNGFAVGKRILPPGARWVEYLESVGGQRIETSLFMDSANWECEAYVNFSGRPKSDNYTIGCVGRPSARYGFVYMYNNQVRLAYVNNTAATKTVSDSFFGLFNLWQASYANGAQTLKAGTYSLSASQEWVDIGEPYRQIQFSNSATTQCTVRFGAIVLRRNSTVVRDFRPIAIGTTGYMLDLVSGEYLPYGNQGTGDFVIGPDINAPAI